MRKVWVVTRWDRSDLSGQSWEIAFVFTDGEQAEKYARLANEESEYNYCLYRDYARKLGRVPGPLEIPKPIPKPTYSCVYNPADGRHYYYEATEHTLAEHVDEIVAEGVKV